MEGRREEETKEFAPNTIMDQGSIQLQLQYNTIKGGVGVFFLLRNSHEALSIGGACMHCWFRDSFVLLSFLFSFPFRYSK